MTPSAQLIVLNWNARPFLAECLPALLAQDYPNFHLTVVDNASSDDSLDYLAAHFPQVEVLANDHNLGFAGGNNVALARLAADFAVLVNPDVIAPPEWLGRLLAPLTADESIAIAGCKITYPDGRLQHVGGLLNRPRAVPDHIGHGEEERGQYDRLADVEYVTGAAMALRRTALEQIGLFDDGYFLYFEEVDLCLRARRAGYRVVCVPLAQVSHIESAVAVKGSSGYLRHMHTSRWRFLLKQEDLDLVLGQTMPAEAAWLAEASSQERWAADWAYRAALTNLPAIWARRTVDGGPPPAEGRAKAVAEALVSLRYRVRQVEAQARQVRMGQVAAAEQVEEPAFRSPVPLVGPLLAGLRDAWSRVATRPMMRPILAQQSALNRLFRRRLAQVNEGLDDQAQRQLEGEAAIMGQDDEVRQLTSRVIRLKERAAALEQEAGLAGDAPSGRHKT